MLEKQEKLLEIAKTDHAYQTWSSIYEEAQAEFDAYVNAQPREVQDILRGYAEGGRLKYQRLVNLACAHMDFSD